jgi:predicted NBD/HSP70 family sugar kinase/transcriptional regulator with XRE-family HTH domain
MSLEGGLVENMDDDASEGLTARNVTAQGTDDGRRAYKDAVRRRTFLKSLRRVRRAAGLTQKTFAAKMESTQPAISELESGRIDPHLRTLQRFARASGRRFDFAFVNPNHPVFDETMADNLWYWVQLYMLGPLLTSIATRPSDERTLEALSREVRLPEPIVNSILRSLEIRQWVTTSDEEGRVVYSLGVAGYVIGISLERDRVVGALIDLQGALVGPHRTIGLDNTLRQTVFDASISVVANLYASRHGHEILGVGATIAGVVDAVTGKIGFAPDLRTDQDLWDGVELATYLQGAVQEQIDERLKVAVENDANSLAMLEHLRSRSHSVMVILLSGAGIGLGLVIQGHIVHGAHSAAGEGGHVIIDPDGEQCRAGFNHRGCVETVASAKAILKRLGQDEPKTTLDLEKGLAIANSRVKHGDPDAVKAFWDAGEAIGRFLSTALTLADPARLLLYGHRELTDNDRYDSAAVFQDGIKEGLKASGDAIIEPPIPEWRPILENTNAVAAAAAALRHFLSDPSYWQPTVVAPPSDIGPPDEDEAPATDSVQGSLAEVGTPLR